MELLYLKTLKELSDNKIEYALLRKPKSWVDIGDLDIILRKGYNIHAKLEKLGYSNRRNSTTYIKYDFSYKNWVYLDINNPLKFGNQYAETSFINDLVFKAMEDGFLVIYQSHAMRTFIHLNDMEAEGYGKFVELIGE